MELQRLGQYGQIIPFLKQNSAGCKDVHMAVLHDVIVSGYVTFYQINKFS